MVNNKSPNVKFGDTSSYTSPGFGTLFGCKWLLCLRRSLNTDVSWNCSVLPLHTQQNKWLNGNWQMTKMTIFTRWNPIQCKLSGKIIKKNFFDIILVQLMHLFFPKPSPALQNYHEIDLYQLICIISNLSKLCWVLAFTTFIVRLESGSLSGFRAYFGQSYD